jgi:hypothetical protein
LGGAVAGLEVETTQQKPGFKPGFLLRSVTFKVKNWQAQCFKILLTIAAQFFAWYPSGFQMKKSPAKAGPLILQLPVVQNL